MGNKTSETLYKSPAQSKTSAGAEVPALSSSQDESNAVQTVGIDFAHGHSESVDDWVRCNEKRESNAVMPRPFVRPENVVNKERNAVKERFDNLMFGPIPERQLRRLNPIESYDNDEQELIQRIFSDQLLMVTKDGGRKRNAGKIIHPWWKDPNHLWKVFQHFKRFFRGETADKDSGAHPLVHVAWRCLCIAYQSTQGKVNPRYAIENNGLLKHPINLPLQGTL